MGAEAAPEPEPEPDARPKNVKKHDETRCACTDDGLNDDMHVAAPIHVFSHSVSYGQTVPIPILIPWPYSLRSLGLINSLRIGVSPETQRTDGKPSYDRSFTPFCFRVTSSLGLSKTSRHSRRNPLIPVSATVSIWLVSQASKWEHVKVGSAGIEVLYNVHTDHEAS